MAANSSLRGPTPRGEPAVRLATPLGLVIDGLPQLLAPSCGDSR